MMKVWQRKGFTLMELLIVMAIIIVLVGLLFPVFYSVRKRSYMAACSSNLKQLYNALKLYEEEYDEFFYLPTGTVRFWSDDKGACEVHKAFYRVIYKYTKDRRIFFCPAERPPDKESEKCPRDPSIDGSYMYYYPFARWAGFPITPNMVCLICGWHAEARQYRKGDTLVITFEPRLVCLMDGSIHIQYGTWRYYSNPNIPFTYP